MIEQKLRNIVLIPLRVELSSFVKANYREEKTSLDLKGFTLEYRGTW